MPRSEKPKSAADLRLRNAVEAMANIFYLLENCVSGLDDVRAYVKVARPVLDIMIQHVQGKRVGTGDGKAPRTGTNGR